MHRKNLKIVVITFENDYFARRYVADASLSWPLLVDTTRETYASYGMLTASFWDVWGPTTWWAYAKGMVRGLKVRGSSGDVYQRGGDILIDPSGIVRLHHVGVGPADRPAVETILSMIAS